MLPEAHPARIFCASAWLLGSRPRQAGLPGSMGPSTSRPSHSAGPDAALVRPRSVELRPWSVLLSGTFSRGARGR